LFPPQGIQPPPQSTSVSEPSFLLSIAQTGGPLSPPPMPVLVVEEVVEPVVDVVEVVDVEWLDVVPPPDPPPPRPPSGGGAMGRLLVPQEAPLTAARDKSTAGARATKTREVIWQSVCAASLAGVNSPADRPPGAEAAASMRASPPRPE
jgi:hypothetical protein